ncbi:MAG: hypothetical protein A4E48_02736 [Methanosaeta sp. PtaU1.Bin060]|nr:MAG: hypothetical protein A4E48_02736 [Methanosaeta sp. PtaU1.Bin060]
MRIIICIVVFMLAVALVESVQLGSANVKPLLLGSISKNVPSNENILNQTNITNQTNVTNQTNITDQSDQGRAAIPISKSMSTIPVTNRYKSVTTPNNIGANSIAYRFTT